MSNGGEIVQNVANLVDALNDLISGNTIEAVIDLAQQMGFQEQIDTGVDALVGMINEIQERLAILHEHLLHLGALSGLIALIRPLMDGLRQVGAGTGQQLEDLGLSGIGVVMEPMVQAASYGDQALEIGEGVLSVAPAAEQVQEVLDSLSGFAEDLNEYKGTASGDITNSTAG